MSKLLKLKSFFTIDEAKKYLSDSLEEPVSFSDIYRLAMDKHLTLSVRLINQAFAIKGVIITGEDGDLVQVQTDLVTGEVLDEPYSVCIDDAIPIDVNKWFLFDEKVHIIDGIWDLAMIGVEALEVERLYQNEVNGPDPVVADAFGIYLRQGEIVCRLQALIPPEATKENIMVMERRLKWILEPKGISIDDFLKQDSDCLYDYLTEAEVEEISFLFDSMRNKFGDCENYEDSLSLEDHSHQFVIRTNELARFVRSLQDEPDPESPTEKILTTTERNTLLTFIDALLKEQQIDSSRKGLAPSLKLMTEKAGRPISENTIRKILSQVSELTA
ncbi:TPA: hypothetical protein ACX6S7_003333 [Photobacterium damselae]